MKRFKRFRKPRYCPNAAHMGYSKYAVSEQDLIRFRVATADSDVFRYSLGRVLGLAPRNGLGKPYEKDTLAVLMAGEMLSHGFVVHVQLEDVVEIVDPKNPGMDFTVWFLTGTMPSPEVADDAARYGALSNGYLSRYLDGDELPKDWLKRAQKKA